MTFLEEIRDIQNCMAGQSQMHLAITFCHADMNKPEFSTNMSLKSYQKRLKFFVIFPINLILVPSYMQKVMANNNCGVNLSN